MNGASRDHDADRVDCERTSFLEAVLDDEERGRLAAVEHYVERFPGIAEFVRAEYAALFAAAAGVTNGGPAAPIGAATGGGAAAPARIGRYAVHGTLGEGGMGRVFDAFDPELDRRVVVKTLRDDLGAPQQAGERLRREARVLGQLTDPGLARVLDLVEHGGRLHLVMAFHEGRTLADHLAAARMRSEGGGIPAARWLTLGAQPCGTAEALRRLVAFFVRAANALGTAHHAGIVHRDLKPQNLMVSPDGSPVVLDFGLALPDGDPRMTVPGELLGTPLYMAPEQIEGGPTDPRTDVHALGVVLYETLTLVHPYAGRGGRAGAFVRILRGDPVPPRRHQPLIPRDLEAVVLRAMDPAPDQRYQTMLGFARDLQRLLDLEPTEARPVSQLRLVWGRVRRRPRLALLLLASGVLLAWVVLAEQRVARYSTLSDRLLELLDDAVAVAPAAAAPEFAAAATELAREREQLRSPADAGGDGLRAVHPRGAVAAAPRLLWTGLPLHSALTQLRGATMHYEYDVRLLDGDATIASWRVPQGDALLCSVPAPAVLVPGRSYRWRVAIATFAVRAADGSALPAVTVDELREAMPDLDAAFVVDPLPAAGQPPSDDVAAAARYLLQLGHAADALLLLDRDPRAAALAPGERQLLVVQAAERLGDDARRLAAQAALEAKVRGR